VDLDDPKTRLPLKIMCGDSLLGNCIAGGFRKDLAIKGLGDGNCAFHFPMPPGLAEPRTREVRIFIGELGYMFVAERKHPMPHRIGFANHEMLAKEKADRSKKRFEKCVLHIGTEKTGTTSVQAFLGLNRDNFASHGYFVPGSLMPPDMQDKPNHVHLAAIALNDRRFDKDLRGTIGLNDTASLSRFRTSVYTAFNDEVAGVPNHCHTLLLSNEHCHSRLQSVEEVAYLKTFLDAYCETYKIIVYLRPQHELAVSQYGMMLADGFYDIDMFPQLSDSICDKRRRYTNWSYFDYGTLLTRWATVFGHNSLVPRIFSRSTLKNGSIIDDFFAGMLPFDEWPRPERQNANLSPRAQKFLLALYPVLAATGHAASAPIGEKIRNILRKLYPGEGTLPCRADAVAFFEQFRVSNGQVLTEWFPMRQKLFDEDFSVYPEVVDSSNLTPHEIIDILVDILCEDQKLPFATDKKS
jgi:hypothetical protein